MDRSQGAVRCVANPYSFLINNPLSFIDPSGFSWLSKAFGAIGGLFKSDTFRALLSIAVGIYLPGLPFMAATFGTFGSYVVTGAIAGGIAAGSLRGALLGGLTAALFYGAGTLAGMTATSYGSAAGEFARAVGHALAGCISAVAGGGSCGPGALSAGFALLATPTIKNAYLAAVEHGVVGGIASTLGGGSFATGMRNGVAGYLFNQVAHASSEAAKRDVVGRPLTDAEKELYAPYIPESALNAAVVFEGKVPFWLRSDMDGITLGNKIYFRAGVYAPDTAAGVEILGHELVHVVQYQSGMTYAGYLWESRNGYQNNKYEVEAYSKGAQMRADFCKASPAKSGC